MRLAQINGSTIDIDDKTAIGLNLQVYDIKQPGKRFINTTNSFTIPATSHNLALFGNANNPQSTSKKIFSQSIFNYWVDNEQLITDARVRVDFITDRIGLFAFEKPSVWDLIKLVKWPDFVSDFIPWLQDNKGLPSKSAPFSGTFKDFVEPYTIATEGVFLPFYYGNLYNYEAVKDSGVFAEDESNLWLRKWESGEGKADGGHMCIYMKTIFEYIEDKYDVNFITGGGEVIGNLWDDPIAPTMFVPIRDLVVMNNVAGDSFYFKYDAATQFLPLKTQKDKSGKTLHGCVNGFMQHFNVIKDDLYLNNNRAIRLARFDDMKDLAEVKEFSSNWTGRPKYVPFIKGYEQENVIKYKEIYEEGDDLLNSRTLTCGNENLNATTPLFEIDAYINPVLSITGGVVPDLSAKEAFKTFSYMVPAGETEQAINIKTEESGNTQTAILKLQKAALYSLDGEYTLIDEVLDEPRYYEWEKRLTLNDIKGLEFFKLYFIRELGGSYFINKITGFNPQKSNKATKLELIKISNRTPISPPDLNYWVDGVQDAWTDGTGDIFY